MLIVTNHNPDTGPDILIHKQTDFISKNDYAWSNRYDGPPMTHCHSPTNPSQDKRYMRHMNYFVTILGGNMVASCVVHDVDGVLDHIRNFEKQSYAGEKINTLMVDYYR